MIICMMLYGDGITAGQTWLPFPDRCDAAVVHCLRIGAYCGELHSRAGRRCDVTAQLAKAGTPVRKRKIDSHR